jgi:hypothetical protein
VSNFLSLKNLIRFRHQPVRDLAWACLSPPMMADMSGAPIWQSPDPAQDLAWFAALDQDPAPLLNYLDQHSSQRLGLYFEQLWRFYWLHHPQAELIAHNLQVVNHTSGQTLGAFDFLLTLDGNYWHMETAVKFYLGLASTDGAASDWQDWRGPGAEDRLDLKLRRLLDHQLALSRDPLTLAQLDPSFANHPWKPCLRLAGYLFYPHDTAMAPPRLVHPQHLRGHWCHWRQWQTVCDKLSDSDWLALERYQWLSPAFCDQEEKLLRGEQSRQVLHRSLQLLQRPVLMARMEAATDGWWEVERWFVVPDAWPQSD